MPQVKALECETAFARECINKIDLAKIVYIDIVKLTYKIFTNEI